MPVTGDQAGPPRRRPVAWPAFATIVFVETLSDRLESYGRLLHEAAHILPFVPVSDATYTPVELEADRTAMAAWASGPDPEYVDKPRWAPHHGQTYLRIASHLWYRTLQLCCVDIPPHFLVHHEYELSPLRDYIDVLTPELRATSTDTPFADIVAMPVPQPFVELFEADKDRWLHRNEVSPDGRLFAVSEMGGAVSVVDLATRQLLHRTQLHSARVDGLGFSPDSSLVASAGSDGFLVVTDARTGGIEWRSEQKGTMFRCADFDPTGRLIATACQTGLATPVEEHKVRLWDAESGELLDEFNHFGNAVGVVIFDPSGEFVLSGGNDGLAILRDVRERHVQRVFQVPFKAIKALRFSPKRDVLAIGGEGVVCLVDYASGRLLSTIAYDFKCVVG